MNNDTHLLFHQTKHILRIFMMIYEAIYLEKEVHCIAEMVRKHFLSIS